MASSGWLEAYITVNSQNVANNTSNVTVSLYFSCSGGAYNQTGNANGAISWGGLWSGSADSTFNASFGQNSYTCLYWWQGDVTHNADGTGSLSMYAWFRTGTNIGTVETSKSVTLPTIPRASAPTVSGTYQLGSNITINTNRKSSAFTHTLKWSWAGKSGTIATGVGASYTWNPAIATFAPYLTTATSGTCTITCDTYSGSTYVGSKTTTFTLSIPASVAPSCSISTSDSSGLLTDYESYVQNQSVVVATTAASGSYGSSIKAYSVVLDSLKGTTATSVLGKPPLSGTRTASVTVTDTRGRTASASKTINVTAWAVPTISSFTANRWTGDHEDDESETVRLHYSGSVVNVASKNLNAHTAKVLWKATSDTTWNEQAVEFDDYISEGEILLEGFDTAITYDFQFALTDSFATSIGRASVGTAKPLMDFAAGGDGMGIGQVAPSEGLGISMDTSFNSGNISLNAANKIRSLNNPGSSWVGGRDNATLRNLSCTNTGSFWPIFSAKTYNGSWDCGTLNNSLYFSFIEDTSYNAGTNASHSNFAFTPGNNNKLEKVYINNTTLLNCIYPVGSVYMSQNSTSPASLFGGGWAQVNGYYIRGAAGNGTAGNTKHTHGSGTFRGCFNVSGNYLYYQYANVPWNYNSNWWMGGSSNGNNGCQTNISSGMTVFGTSSETDHYPTYKNFYVWYRTS